MPDLFTPLPIAGRTLPNRIVRAPLPSGLASRSGFAGDALVAHYARLARGGIGLLCSEPLLALPPGGLPPPHLGAYDDAFVPGLQQLARAASAHGAHLLLSLEAPAALTARPDLAPVREALLLAAWRAHAAGADGILLSAADGGLLHQLLSPRHNRRADGYGGDLDGRLRLARELVEGVRRWVGRRLLVAVRLPADELIPGGIGLHETRGAARRLAAAGAQLLDIAPPPATAQVARFPGWAIPLAGSVKRIVDVPVIGSGLLGDPELADAMIRDGSVDLVMLGATLHADPDWPRRARERLAPPRA